MSHTVHAFDYLAAAPVEYPPAAVCVLFGDEPLLKRLCWQRLRKDVLGDGDQDVPYAEFDGQQAEWRDVRDELATISLFGSGRRLALVDDADELVRRFRPQLERYVARPAEGGVLVLRVGLWQSNTRLYKAIDLAGLQIACRLPERGGKRGVLDETRLADWLTERAQDVHQVHMTRAGVDVLLDLVGTNLGLLDQELAKLALYAEEGGKVSPEKVREVVGGWRTESTWEILDRAAEGKVEEALMQLDQLLARGERPIALFGAISWSLRRFATATRIYEQAEREGHRVTIADALVQAGFRPWPTDALKRAERQLRQLGRRRTRLFYRWLLDMDLAMKLSHSQDDRARLLLEQLFVRMSKQFSPHQSRGN
jgi:DNA polymerase-3 subunit delta